MILTKDNFATILQLVLQSHINVKTLKNCLKACRLHPWEPNTTDYSKCVGTSNQSPSFSGQDSVIVTENKNDTTFDLEEKSLTLSDFIHIVGSNVLQKFSLMKHQVN